MFGRRQHNAFNFYIVWSIYNFKIIFICNTFLKPSTIMKTQLQACLYYKIVYIKSNITVKFYQSHAMSKNQGLRACTMHSSRAEKRGERVSWASKWFAVGVPWLVARGTARGLKLARGWRCGISFYFLTFVERETWWKRRDCFLYTSPSPRD